MAEYIDREAVNASEREEEKIKTPFLHIVVGGKPEKPCYSILWVDSETQEFQFGYSSYCLDYVREWRDKYFEITTEDFPNADVVEVVRCWDCIHYAVDIDGWTPYCLKHKIAPLDNDFCSYGERKNG